MTRTLVSEWNNRYQLFYVEGGSMSAYYSLEDKFLSFPDQLFNNLGEALLYILHVILEIPNEIVGKAL